MIDDLNAWIDSISTPSPSFNGHPACPFAGRSRKAGLIYVMSIPWANICPAITDLVAIWPMQREFDHFAVIMRIRRPPKPSEVKAFAREVNDQLLGYDLIVMVSDYRTPTKINGQISTNPKYVILIIQRRGILDAASIQLRKTNYYDTWPKRVYQSIVANR